MEIKLITQGGYDEWFKTVPITDRYLAHKNIEDIFAPSATFHASIILDEVDYFRTLTEEIFDVKKSNVNYYAVIRTATSIEVLVSELEKEEDFFRDRSLGPNNLTQEARLPKFRRIGNWKNVVFYHCPVYTDLRSYTVEFGLKHKQNALCSNSSRNLTSTFRFDREVPKKLPQDETTKILPKPLVCPINVAKIYDLNEEKESSATLDELIKETANIPNSVPYQQLPNEERVKVAKEQQALISNTSTPITLFDPEQIKELQESLKEPAVKIKVPNYVGPMAGPTVRKSELPLEGRELEEQKCIQLADELRNEYKKLEEKEKCTISSYEYSGYTTGPYKNVNEDSVPVADADYETKFRAFSQVKGPNLPQSFLNAVKGFYIKDPKEIELFNRLSDESIIVYKIRKLKEYSDRFTTNNIYSKTEIENMLNFKTTYVKHNVLAENDVKFILVKSNDLDFNFYGHQVQDKQQLQDKTYHSLYDLVENLKHVSKDNLIFIKQISQEEYYEALAPSLKCFNEYKIKCYFLPKNKF